MGGGGGMINMVELVGWIGAAGFALCAIPQAYKTVKTGKADDISWLFLFLWLTGEVAMIAYLILTTMDPIFLVNYVFNLACLLIILGVKVKNV